MPELSGIDWILTYNVFTAYMPQWSGIGVAILMLVRSALIVAVQNTGWQPWLQAGLVFALLILTTLGDHVLKPRTMRRADIMQAVENSCMMAVLVCGIMYDAHWRSREWTSDDDEEIVLEFALWLISFGFLTLCLYQGYARELQERLSVGARLCVLLPVAVGAHGV
jgi:hypothetical protein